MQRKHFLYAVLIAMGMTGYGELAEASLGPYEPKGSMHKQLDENASNDSLRYDNHQKGTDKASKGFSSKPMGKIPAGAPLKGNRVLEEKGRVKAQSGSGTTGSQE